MIHCKFTIACVKTKFNSSRGQLFTFLTQYQIISANFPLRNTDFQPFFFHKCDSLKRHLKMLLKVVVFVLLSMACLADIEMIKKKHKPKHKDCDHLKTKLTLANNDFLRCVMDYNQNATFCLECKEFYTRTFHNYELMLNSYDTIESNKTCRELFVDNNQLNLVELLFSNAKKFWDHGFCSDCFVPDCDFSNETENCNFSDHTINFTRTNYLTELCIDQTLLNSTDKMKPCENCSTNYENLNKIYNDIRVQTTDKFCFAIKDMMNKTRIRWSKELQCCGDRKYSKEEFLTLSSSSVFFSIIFYVAIYLFGLRKERIQYVPDDLMPPPSDDQNHSNGTIMNINSEEPSTSESPAPIEQKLAKKINVSEDSSSEDEEILPIQNPNLIQI
ncbi:uncharacterized protein LOC129576348 [Sitodiplosis mosellana]|uniref:uncharacterized protein LOC129576348 n=1 Tax=Sitodiplosis mosellana TaxID=263140 RepID=UPI002444EC9B|nr:uncharacterized protein LOC129576348 [Sitodiplosis mosellana]